AAVQHGWHRAVKMLQSSVGEKPDGIIGPKTLSATQTMDLNDLLMRYIAYRITFYTKVSTFNEYGRGWMRRVAQCLLFAAVDNDL
ncbi:secretion activator protein, partial [Vibrio cholerae]